MQYIGKVDRNKLGKYKDIITTDVVVLTDERKAHIYQDHIKDYDIIMKNLKRVVLNPREVLEDIKNEDTIFLIYKLGYTNLNVVIKLNTNNDQIHPQNSIMTAWIIRDSNLKKLRKRNKILYKSE